MGHQSYQARRFYGYKGEQTIIGLPGGVLFSQKNGVFICCYQD